jgi:hypothetical protein
MSELPNVQQSVPFLWVTDIEASLAFYVQGLGFMLQEYVPDRYPTVKLGVGVSICFQCRDALALYSDFLARGLQPQRPFVGNSMWVTLITDPDGYKLDFESPTDALEESLYDADEKHPARAAVTS